jgi:hypothetical protein
MQPLSGQEDNIVDEARKRLERKGSPKYRTCRVYALELNLWQQRVAVATKAPWATRIVGPSSPAAGKRLRQTAKA